MSLLARDFEELFPSVWGLTSTMENYPTRYNVVSSENEHVIEVPLVGMTRDNVTVDVQDNVLSVTANTESKSRFIKNFKQTWTLSKDINPEAVSASLENGLLTIRVPRVKPARKVVNVAVA